MWYDELVAKLSAEGVELSESDINIMKKYTNEVQFNKAAFHAFRRASSSISLPPGDDNEKRQRTIEILRKLGADKENYNIKIPDGYPEDIRPSEDDIKAFIEQSHNLGLLPHQVEAKFNASLEALKNEYEEKTTKEKESQQQREKQAEELKNN